MRPYGLKGKDMDLTQKIIELDRRSLQMISKAERDAALQISYTERLSEKIIADAQKSASKRRHEELEKLQNSLELLKRKKEKEIESAKRDIALGFSDRKIAKEISDLIVKKLVSDIHRKM